MSESNVVGYAVDAREADRKERFEEQIRRVSRKGSTPDGPPDFMNVQGQINLLRNDMNQLLEEVSELRARLSPVLREADNKHSGREFCPVRSGMAAELGEIHMVLCNAREVVELTIMQLDI